MMPGRRRTGRTISTSGSSDIAARIRAWLSLSSSRRRRSWGAHRPSGRTSGGSRADRSRSRGCAAGRVDSVLHRPRVPVLQRDRARAERARSRIRPEGTRRRRLLHAEAAAPPRFHGRSAEDGRIVRVPLPRPDRPPRRRAARASRRRVREGLAGRAGAARLRGDALGDREAPQGTSVTKRRMAYIVIVERGEKGYGAYVPDLPGCVAVGETKEEAAQ